MLYLAIPAHNEAATIGVLLWRLRTVLAEFPREYEAVVYDDASDDSTSEILESYARVMPLTVLRGERRIGYAGAVDALIRHVARDTRYPRRDAMLLLQGDFTDSPTLVPEFVKRFEGGTDVVVGERGSAVRRKAPTQVRRLMRAEPWLLRFLVRADGIRDLTSSYRLIRISVLRDLLRSVGDGPACTGDPRTANADLLMRLVPLARRVETLPVEPTWEVRLRETRVVAFSDGMNLLRWAWKSRGQRAVPSSAPEPAADHTPKHTRSSRAERPDREGRPELRLESRSDWSADSAATVAESSRHSGNRDSARNGRKVRSSRSDARTEGRGTEPRTKGSAREGAKGTARDAALNAERESVTPLQDVDGTSSERPGKRKRSRRGGRDRDSVRPDSEENSLEAATADESAANVADQGSRRAASSPAESDDEAPPRVAEVSLSAGLSDAVADAETELDGEGRQRPRRKRRRRGSRNGRGGGDDDSPAEGDLADGGAPEAAGPMGESVEAGDGDEDSPGENGARSRHSRREAVRESGSNGADLADGAASGTDGDDGEGSSSSEDLSPEGAEARTRRRGRRGRRGGSRRSRVQRGEGGGEEIAGEADTPREPAREPTAAPEPE